MKKLPETAHWLWRVPLAAAAYALGAMLVGGLMQASGAPLPSSPVPPEPARDIVLLFVAGLVMALALAAMGAGIAGRWWQRWGLLTAFIFVVYGVGNALEGSIFTTLGGQWILMWINVAAGTLCALAVSLGGGGAPQGSLGESFAGFRRKGSSGSLLWRIGLAILAFPFFYFLFGMLIAPIVVPHYAQLDFLTIPPMPTMLQVLFLRSALFLIVSLPIVAAWRRSRVALVIALGLGHFVAVGFAGLIQVSFFPAVLRWTHSLEILADSMFYAWALAWLFVPRAEKTRGGLEREEIERTERFA